MYIGLGKFVPDARFVIANADSGINSMWLESFGTATAPSIYARASRGTQASPTATQSTDTIFALTGGGYYTSGGTGYGDTAAIKFVATQNHTSSARGTKITFEVTDDGLTSRSPVLEILQDGGLIAPNVYGDTVGATNRDLYIDNTGRIGYVSSSLRYKDEVTELPAIYSDAFIERVQAISFVYKGDERRQRQIGFAAETVSELGAYNDAGLPETVYYSRFVVPLWASHQRLLARVAMLEKRLAALN